MKSILSLLSLSAATVAWAGLPAVGPDYVRPEAPTADAFRDTGDAPAWKTAAPSDELARGDWWTLFGDPTLNDLETRALAANQELRAAAARVEQARALAGEARGAYWPSLAVGAAVDRERTSRTTENALPDSLTTTYRTPLTASWEIDLFGRVRRLNENARAQADESAALFESLRLSLTAEVATNYVTLAAAERELEILRNTVNLRGRALELVMARVRSGTAADLDQARAETELALAEADVAAVENRRAKLSNALAVLVGEAPSRFTVSADAQHFASPRVPAGLPSDLLERRPDIAAAERALAAANARIGVAKAAFFPAISLTGGFGQASGDIDRLLDSDSRTWSIGPRLYLPIFQGGRNRANLARSRGAYDEAVARYRQQVLVAFREVQDALTATRLLEQQSAAQARALAAAQRATSRAQTRYDSGFVSYLEVIDAQRTALAVERASVQLAAQRVTASIDLIKALGGGWNASSQNVAVAVR
jgi:multidrug efflux system outer membrane protein